ncbi:MAG: ABC transporter ATP-binding protein [Actinomycetota bacterium]|nr:ABC transporter ATP-binding protein [Actinomycetota bacterium]
MAAAIEIEHVSKSFKIYQEKYTSAKERMIHFGRVPHETFQALDDVSLRIEAGQTMGLLGHNGSGKSTLLKCMAGILQPSTGSVRTVGRLAALLELGAGFQADLTGRENVYLNASILGLKKGFVDKVFDEIVHFSELDRFIDTPVKHYSSGMYIRLGFATAVHVDPEILLVDEVLAVGDESFQRKCLDKVRTFQSEGRTIVVVTHAADLVRQMCDTAAALDHGKLVIQGDPNDVIREFRERLMSGVTSAADISPEMASSELSPLWGKVRIEDVHVNYPEADRHNVQPGESLNFDVHLVSEGPVDDVVIGIAVYGPMGELIYGTNSSLKGADLGIVDGRRKVRFDLGSVPLLDGTYGLTVGVHTHTGLVYDHWEQKRRFEVAAGGRDQGMIALPVQITVDQD